MKLAGGAQLQLSNPPICQKNKKTLWQRKMRIKNVYVYIYIEKIRLASSEQNKKLNAAKKIPL